jgi:hypothetical protein
MNVFKYYLCCSNFVERSIILGTNVLQQGTLTFEVSVTPDFVRSHAATSVPSDSIAGKCFSTAITQM